MTDFPTLRFAHLYPALLNVAGDGGNLMALRRRSAWRGIPTETVDVGMASIRTSPNSTSFSSTVVRTSKWAS